MGMLLKLSSAVALGVMTALATTLQAVLFLGYLFLLGTAVWAIVTIRRMRGEQERALMLLSQMASLAGLKRVTDELHQAIATPTQRREGSNEPSQSDSHRTAL